MDDCHLCLFHGLQLTAAPQNRLAGATYQDARGFFMIGRAMLTTATALLAPCVVLNSNAARAQDVPGIEICTVEKTMERRTSCLQSNVIFLQKTIGKLGLDSQAKLDAANRQIEALKVTVTGLQKTVEELQAAQKKTPPAAKETPAVAAPAKDGAAK
jgi:hypothetical protein